DVGVAGFGEQLLDLSFRLVVGAFAEVVISNTTLRIRDVERRPIRVVERLPDRVVVVDGGGEIDVLLAHRAPNVVHVLLELELGRLDVDHDHALVSILLGPGADVGEHADRVDAGVGGEVDDHDLAAQAGRVERARAEPGGRSIEGGQGTLVGQAHGCRRCVPRRASGHRYVA